MGAIALICPRIRIEEKALLAAFEERNVLCEPFDPAAMEFEWGTSPLPGFHGALLSGVEPDHAAFLTQWLEAVGVSTVNPSHVAACLADRLALHLALWGADLPTPRASIAFSSGAAIEAIEEMGYPVSGRPIHPDSGALTARLNDRAAATAVIEHRKRLGGFRHGVTYIEEVLPEAVTRHRFLVIDGQWIPPETAEPLMTGLGRLAGLAGRAVGGGIVTVDIESTGDDRAWISDVSSPSRFREIGAVAEIARCIVDHVLEEVSMQDSSER